MCVVKQVYTVHERKEQEKYQLHVEVHVHIESTCMFLWDDRDLDQ